MKLSATGLILSTCCFLLAGCGQPSPRVEAVKPPAARLQCEGVDPSARPVLPAAHVIDWSRVATVAQARAEHEAYVGSVIARNGVVSGYIVLIEGRLFACSSNMTWLRDFFARLPDQQ